MGSEQPAGWSKRLPSAAAASEEAKGGLLFQYVEPPSAARTKLADFFNILLGACPRLAIVARVCWVESDFSIV